MDDENNEPKVVKEHKNRDHINSFDNDIVTYSRIKSTLDNIEMKYKIECEFGLKESSMRSICSDDNFKLAGFKNDDKVFIFPITKSLVMDCLSEIPKPNPKELITTSSEQQPASQSIAKPRTAGALGKRNADNDQDMQHVTRQKLIPWREVEYFGYREDQAEANLKKLIKNQEDFITPPSADPNEFIEKFLDNYKWEKPTGKSTSLDDNDANASLSDTIEKIMIQVKVIRFNKLFDCLKDKFYKGLENKLLNATKLLPILQRYAILLHGWWVVKSELLYPKNSLSEHGSIPAEIMVRTRDYIMAVFFRGENLTRKTISSLTKLPAVEVTDVLENLAKKGTSSRKGQANHWEFRAPDTEFIRKYNSVVVSQNLEWENRIKTICSEFGIEKLISSSTKRRRNGSGLFSSGSDTENDTTSKQTSRRGRQRNSESTSSRRLSESQHVLSPSPVSMPTSVSAKSITEISTSAIQASTIASPKSPPQQQQMTMPTSPPKFIRKRSRSECSPEGSPAPVISPKRPQVDNEADVVNHQIGSIIKIKSTSSGERVNQKEISFLKDLLNSSPVLPLDEAVSIYIGNLANNPFIHPITKSVYESDTDEQIKAISDYLVGILTDELSQDCKEIHPIWAEIPSAVEKKRLFIVNYAANLGPIDGESHKIRDCIIQICEERRGFTLVILKSKVDSACGPHVKEKLIKTILKTYCVFRSGKYYLRCMLSQ